MHHISPKVGDISFGAASAFMLGVLAANLGWGLWVLVGTIAMISGGLALFFDVRDVWKYIALFCFAVVAGVLYYHAYLRWQTAHKKMPTGKDAAFFGIITDEPKPAGNFTMLAVSLLRPYAGTVDIFTSPGNAQFHYGDEVWIQGTLDASQSGDEPPAVFLPHLRVIAEHEGSYIKETIIDLKDAITRKIAELLPADQAALLAGIMLGTSGTLGATLTAQMEASGTSYIVNMYGYKIIILTSALAMILKDHVSRRTLLWITLGAIGIFVLASGGTISAIRAAVMGVFAVVARGTGRMFSARNAVTFAALGMVLLNVTLLTDAAFQLSFLSFLGIYYLGPPVNNFFHWTDRGVLDWKSHAMLSLTTNLAILPVVMNTFGEFSLASFISNILIMIPWVAVIAFGTLAVLCGFILPVLAFPATQIVSVLLRYELFIIHAFSVVNIPIPSVFGSAFVVALYYGMLFLFAHYYAAPSQKNN